MSGELSGHCVADPQEVGCETPSATPCELSVVVPVFRARPYIEECISSLIDGLACVARADVILVDNHCDDGSVETAFRLLHQVGIEARVVFEKVRGAGAARNCGVRESRGEWLQFLDADDVLGAGKISRQLAMAKLARPEVGVIFSRWVRCDRWLAPLTEVRPVLRERPPGLLVDLLRDSGFLSMGSALIRKSAFEAAGGFGSQPIVEDVNLYVRMAGAGVGFVHCELPSPALFYRDSGSSLSKSSVLDFWRGVADNALIADSIAHELGGWSGEDIEVIERCLAGSVYAVSTVDMQLADQITELASSRGLRLERSIPGFRGSVYRLFGMPGGLRLARAYRRMRSNLVPGRKQ